MGRSGSAGRRARGRMLSGRTSEVFRTTHPRVFGPPGRHVGRRPAIGPPRRPVVLGCFRPTYGASVVRSDISRPFAEAFADLPPQSRCEVAGWKVHTERQREVGGVQVHGRFSEVRQVGRRFPAASPADEQENGADQGRWPPLCTQAQVEQAPAALNRRAGQCRAGRDQIVAAGFRQQGPQSWPGVREVEPVLAVDADSHASQPVTDPRRSGRLGERDGVAGFGESGSVDLGDTLVRGCALDRGVRATPPVLASSDEPAGQPHRT
ncbi:hypothetical protein DDQ41_25460 [Streptomyces spongiicola]|uniref:Uncharacterized protein n=1 Tax=Streptomyces spongiicola TaxID=1690221 RepID=A0ABM6VCR9_9ACTN|nr:hypothetical protein DDQ41_25460 [Streptomyces spongiicola]